MPDCPQPPSDPPAAGEPMTRVAYDRGLQGSDLQPLDRLVAMVLASKADFRTCEIPERRMPALSSLATDTGMSLASVKRSLNRLEEAGWVKRAPGRGRGNRTSYALSMPGKWLTQSPFSGGNRLTGSHFEG